MKASPLVLLSLVLLAGPALAQNPPPPKFTFEKPPEAPADWQLQSKGGLLLTTGNSRSTNATLSLNASRQAGDHKLSLDGHLAYGRSRIVVPVFDPAMPATVVALDRRLETTTNEWRAKGRYDRFITANNAGYVLGQLGADRIAGKRLVGGGQAGYSRQLVKSEHHTLLAELGYDFSYESYIQQPGKDLSPVAIHSARLFAGHQVTLTADTGISTGIEALFNLNEENALDADDPTGMTRTVAAFSDTRIHAKTNLTTRLWSNVSFGFGFTLRFDQNPAPLPVPAAAKGGAYAPGFQPFAERVDTLTEATVIITFL